MNLLVDHEPLLRLGCFLAVLLLMLTWESLAPRRAVSGNHWLRLGNNLLLVLFNTVLLRLLPAIAAVGTAVFATEKSIGLLNLVPLPAWAGVVAAFVLLDLAIYGQHVLFHKVHWCWLLHRVHHSDKEFDVSTGVRFHPLEIVLSMLIKMLVVLLIGAPVAAVIIFEIILNATSLFNHGNVRIPATVDRLLRAVIVTPDMHRVHHSVLRPETDSNFGFNFSFWDRLFRTYRPRPEAGHERMEIGLSEFREQNTISIAKLLVQPFEKAANRG